MPSSRHAVAPASLVRPLFAALLLAGCSCATTPAVFDRGIGDACESSTECRSGLVCTMLTCQPSRSAPLGHSCVLTLDCADGLFCGASRTCETSGMGGLGADCSSSADCTSGLVCVIEGFGERCRMPGTRDVHNTCNGQGDCLAGLTCTMGPYGTTCESPLAHAPPSDGAMVDAGAVPMTPPVLGHWDGATCATDDSPAHAYFEVPRHGPGDHDFFRLPFPSDVRRTATGLDLQGFPSPGTALPLDVLGRYVTAAQTDLDGFATNAVAYFRFSRPYDWGSVGGHIHVVDITMGSPTYGQERGLAWLTTSGRLTKYICEDWLGVRTGHGDPLRPGTTYAVYLTSGITDTNHNVFARDRDFDAVMATAMPSDTALMAAWQAHAPFRAFLADQSIDPTTVLNAAVFTTQTANDRIPALRAAELAAPLATLHDAVVCDGTAPSPCDDGTELRRCGTPDPAFVEIHGRLSLPIFQQGTAPYEEPADGGDIAVDAMGHPMVVRTENVCVSITVPTAAAPASGYPVLVAAHGTGGSFTDHIRLGLARDVAMAATPAVTIGIDLPQHGARRGASTRSPDRLVYNFSNPRAARDVFLQGAADLMGTIRFAHEATIDAASSPTHAAIPLDPAHIVLLGHSQGAQHAALLAGDEPSLTAVVLSEAGGDLTQSLLHKTLPYDIASIVPLALLDFDGAGHLAVGDYNPALALFQTYFERSDAVNYARRLARDVPMGAPGLHVMATYGVGDHYTPEETLQAYALAGSFPLVNPVLVSFGPSGLTPPVSANVMIGATPFTFAMRQYTPPAGVDGHFVAFQSTDGRADLVRFLSNALGGATPPIGM
jgi:dienelactone hydrolase